MTGTVVFCYQYFKGMKTRCDVDRTKQAVKVIECVFERRIRKKVKVNEVQFGLRLRNGTTNEIITIRQTQEKYRNKQKKFFFAGIEKLLDRVYVGVTRWALSKVDVEEWFMNAVVAVNEGAQMVEW